MENTCDGCGIAHLTDVIYGNSTRVKPFLIRVFVSHAESTDRMQSCLSLRLSHPQSKYTTLLSIYCRISIKKRKSASYHDKSCQIDSSFVLMPLATKGKICSNKMGGKYEDYDWYVFMVTDGFTAWF